MHNSALLWWEREGRGNCSTFLFHVLPVKVRAQGCSLCFPIITIGIRFSRGGGALDWGNWILYSLKRWWNSNGHAILLLQGVLWSEAECNRSPCMPQRFQWKNSQIVKMGHRPNIKSFDWLHMSWETFQDCPSILFWWGGLKRMVNNLVNFQWKGGVLLPNKDRSLGASDLTTPANET